MFRIYCTYLSFLSFFLSLFTFADEVDDVYEAAIQASPLVLAQHAEGCARRSQERDEINAVRRSLVEHPEKGEELYENVRRALEADARFFEKLDVALEPYKPGDEHGTTWQIKTQKMTLALKGALSISEKDFWTILEGDSMPEGYDYIPPSLNRFRESSHIYSSGRGIALKTLLWRTWGILNKRTFVADFPLLGGADWLDHAACAHITALPKGFEMEGLEDSPYFYSDPKTPAGLVIFVNGYAFGGHRNEPRYLSGKTWAPEDCSSWIARIVACKAPFSTVHQYLDYNAWTGFSLFKEYIDRSVVKQWDFETLPAWRKDPFRRPIEDTLEPFPIKDPQTDLKPGLIHGERGLATFVADDITTHTVALYGQGGHTSLFLGIVGSGSETKALTLGFNRDIEGTGRDGAYAVEPRLLWAPDPTITKRSIFYHKPTNVIW